MNITDGSFGKALYLFAITTTILVLMPQIVVIATAFNPEHMVFPPEGFSLRWFKELPKDSFFMRSLGVSAVIGFISSILSTIIGTSAAVGLRYSSKKVSRLVSGVMLAPLFIPTVVTGLALYQMSYLLLGGKSPLVLLLGHVILTIPFPLRNVVASLEGLPLSLDEAAMNVGAPPWYAVRKILLPLIKPGVFSGWLMAFIMSWNDFNVSLFLSTPGYNPLAIQIYTYIAYEYKPILAAMSVYLILIACLAVIILNKLVGLSGLTGSR